MVCNMFITTEELFKYTVMFFSLMNSFIMFQTIINEILINIKEVVSFLNNVIMSYTKFTLSEDCTL